MLSSRPSEAEAGFSFLALTDLLGEVAADVLPELPPIQRRALEAALLLGESELPADTRAVAAAFLGALRLLAADRALCLAVDDVQWLDSASLSALRYAVARLDHEQVATVLAVRDDVPEWVRRAVPEDRLRTVRVGGLSLGATHELLRNRLGATFARPVLIKLWETAGGNPFFALELATALQRRGGTLAAGEDLPIPTGLDELLRVRLDGVGADALEVASTVAALAEPTVSLVESVVGAGYEAGLAEAVAAGILELDRERIRFTHPLLGSAVAVRLTPSRRHRLHARLAEAAPTVEERARHLALAAAEPRSRDRRDPRGRIAGGSRARRVGRGRRPGGAGAPADTAERRGRCATPSLPRGRPARPRRRHRPRDRPAGTSARRRLRAASSAPRRWSGWPTCRTIPARRSRCTARHSPKLQETMRSQRRSTPVSLSRWPGTRARSRGSPTPSWRSAPPRGSMIRRSAAAPSQPSETGTSGPAGESSMRRWTRR